MTARKRKNKISSCNQCGAIVPDEEKHLASFGVNNHEIIASTFLAPFIFDQKLFTSRTVPIPLDVLKLYNGYYSDFILMNPEDMRLCGFIIGSQCLMVSLGGSISKIVTVFADSEIVNSFSVGIPLDFDPIGPFMVKAIDQRTRTSISLKISNVNQAELNDEVRQHIHSRLVGNYVISGREKSFWYFGEFYTVEIVDLSEDLPLDTISETVVGTSVSEKTIESYAEFLSACSEFESNSVDEVTANSTMNGHSSEAPLMNFEGYDNFSIQLTDSFPFSMKIVLIGQETIIKFDENEANKEISADNQPIYLSNIGGMTNLVDKMTNILNYFNCDGFGKCPGILISGPPGCGKTSLVHAVVNQLNSNIFVLSSHDCYLDRSKFDGKITEFFARVGKSNNSVALIEDVDLLVPRKCETDTQRTVKYCFLSRLDRLVHMNSAFVVCCTNSLEHVDISLRRRLDCEIEVPTPNSTDRLEIFNACLARLPSNCVIPDQVVYASEIACGYVAGDIASVCRLAYRDAVIKGEPIQLDLIGGLKAVKPSSMKELSLDVPQVRWSDIGGLDKIKEGIMQLVEWPIVHQEAFSRMGIMPPRGILMYGPPGCSKTMIAKAIANESHFNFISVKGSELLSKFVGESEKMVRELFARARAASPAVVFFDEIDALAPGRGSHSVTDRVLAQLLTELDGVETLCQVVFIAATNRPDMIDQALLRPGRVDRLVYVSLPDEASRRKIFDIQLKQKPLARDVVVGDLARCTDGYSGAEIVAVCQEAALEALTENIKAKCTEGRHFISALEKIRPRTDKKLLEIYKSFSDMNSSVSGRLTDLREKNDSEKGDCVKAGETSSSLRFFVSSAVLGTLIAAGVYLVFKIK